jgi:hypothetical protein
LPKPVKTPTIAKWVTSSFLRVIALRQNQKSYTKLLPGGLRRVPHDLEVRMQKFAAIALVPDYEHELYLEEKVQAWEKFNAVEASKQRNLLIRDHMTKVSFQTLNNSYKPGDTADHPTPDGHNVHGQLSVRQSGGKNAMRHEHLKAKCG